MSRFGLTPREREFVELLAQGHRATEAARIMGIADYTAREYRRGACRKMGATSGLQLAVRWLLEVELKRVYLAGYRRGAREAREAWERAWKS